MDFSKDETKAISSKCLSLIARTIKILNRIDESNFPTLTTKDAVSLLQKALKWLENPSNLESIDPVVLYNRLFAMQKFVEIVEDSSSDRISWPLVSYCDDIWKKLFPGGESKIFYSITSQHNYFISPYSDGLAIAMNGLMPLSEIKNITDNNIYCLQLASTEDANLQLYANIGHEFGHAIFYNREKELIQSLDSNFTNLMHNISSDVSSKDAANAVRIMIRILYVINKIATELFCDLVGIRLMGPAFFLSFYELSWGQDNSVWNIMLSPDNNMISAYPSFHFRLDCLFTFGDIDNFCNDAKKDFTTEKCLSSDVLAGCLMTIPRDHTSDKIAVYPRDDQYGPTIESTLTKHLTDIKKALIAFLKEADKLMFSWYPNVIISKLDTAGIAKLLLRLNHDIPPNIIPDTSLLGIPASFQAVLNASALYRINLLVNKEGKNVSDLAHCMGKLERLTAKSFEVTYIQQKYIEWENNRRGGNSK
ncbi:MAG TPA: hypothetical protein VMU29_00310 [Smithella sp.]|nr:hypothetical protein [Smithella sp.]